jgi:hypothetical protein
MNRLKAMSLMFLLFCFALAGCGGGTTGTGLKRLELEGRVFDQAGSPIADATVHDEVSGESTRTDQKGAFKLSIPKQDSLIIVNGVDKQGEEFELQLVLAPDLPTADPSLGDVSATADVATGINSTEPLVVESNGISLEVVIINVNESNEDI